MGYILIEILFVISMVFIMAEWVYVLTDMVREKKGTRFVKSSKSIRYSEKKDGLLNTTRLYPCKIKKYRYINNEIPMIGDM